MPRNNDGFSLWGAGRLLREIFMRQVPVKDPGERKWSSFRHYALREIGIVEIESEWTAREIAKQKPAGDQSECSSTQSPP
jgi:hypothetical protein